MDPSTIDIALDIEAYLQVAYPQLFWSTPVLVVGLIVLLVGTVLFFKAFCFSQAIGMAVD